MSVSSVSTSVQGYSLPESPSQLSRGPNNAASSANAGTSAAATSSDLSWMPANQRLSQSQVDATAAATAGRDDNAAQSEIEFRRAQVTRLLGNTDAGGRSKGMDQQFGDRVADVMSRGNPYQRAVLTSVFGGLDPTTGQKLAPAWERLGMSRADFKRELIETPWEITNRHLAGSGVKEITQQDYESLQSLHGPLGHLLGMGVEPQAALAIQEDWGLSFYGGVDREGRASRPVWERWNFASAQDMQPMFENDPLARAQFARLTGGADPSGQSIDAPFGEKTPQRYAQSLLSQAQSTLGVRATPVNIDAPNSDALDVAQRDLHSLSFTTVSVRDMLGLVQSPHVRNDATKLGDPGTTGAIGSTVLTPGESYPGLFGYFRMTGKEKPETNLDRWVTNLLGPGNGVQLHGMWYPISQNGEWTGLGGFAKLQFLPPQPTAQNAAGDQVSDPSAFYKFIGQYTPENWKINLFKGAADESDSSRGRSPGFLFVEHFANPDGTSDRVKVSFGGAVLNKFFSEKSLDKVNLSEGKGGHALGPTIEFRQVDGTWYPSLDGWVVEGGKLRWQFYASTSHDPITQERDGLSIMFGTGHALAMGTWQRDQNNPTPKYFADQGYASFSNPDKFSWSFSAFGGYPTMKGVSGGFGIAADTVSNTEVIVRMPDRALSETAAVVAKDVHAKLADGTLTYETLPEGVGVSDTTSRDQTSQLMAFLKFYVLPTIAGGYGSAERFEVLRNSADTWVVSRFTDARSNLSGSIGSFGIGAAGLRYSNDHAGESFKFEGRGAQLIDAQREALTIYQRDGIPPGALQLDQGRLPPPADLDAYRAVRESVNHFTRLRNEFADLPEGDAALDALIRNSNDRYLTQVLRKRYEQEGRYIHATKVDLANYLNSRQAGAVAQLTQIYRDTIKPGMQVMDGITLERRVISDTESRRLTLVLPVSRRDYGHRSNIDPQGTTSGYSNVVEKAFWPINQVTQTSLDWRVNTRSPEENRVRLSVAGQLPLADIRAAEVRIGADAYIQQAIEQGRVDANGTTLWFDLGDADLTALGKDLLQGESGARLWESFRERALAVLQGRPSAVKDIRDYAGLGTSLADLHTKFDAVAYTVLKEQGIDRATLTEFVRTMTPDKFAAADQNTKNAVLQLVLSTSSGAHSRFETLGLLSRVPDSAQRLTMFSRIVEDAGTPVLQSMPDPEQSADRFTWMPTGHGMSVQTPREGHYTRDEPTLEFMRFVKDEVHDPQLAKRLLSQAGAQLHPPEVVTKHLTDSPQDLSAALNRVAQSKSYSQDAASALIAVARRDGAPGAWRFLHENKIDARHLLGSLGSGGEDQILRNMVVDVLAPGAQEFAPGMGKFFADERKAAEGLMADSQAAYPISPAHALEIARGEFAVETRAGGIASSNVATQIRPMVVETARILREVALAKYGAAAARMVQTGQIDQLDRQDALAYASHLLFTQPQLRQHTDAGELTRAIGNAMGPEALRFLQQQGVPFSEMAQAEARRQKSFLGERPLGEFISYHSDTLAQAAAGIVFERAQPVLAAHVSATNSDAYRTLIAVPREEFLAQHTVRARNVGHGLIAYSNSVQAYVRENGAADLSDMDLRALIAGGGAASRNLDVLYGAQAKSLRDRLAKDRYTEQDVERLGRLPKQLDTGSKQQDEIAAQLTLAAAQFVASGDASSTTRAAPGSLVPQSMTDIYLGGDRRAYRTTFAMGKEGLVLVQLLPRDRGSATASALSPEGEHFLLDANGKLKLWMRREPGTDKLYVVHHEGKDPLTANPTGLLSVRPTSWNAVRDALANDNLSALIVTPAATGKGDLRYSELQSTWTTYDSQNRSWVARVGDVEPMLFAVRSPNEMYVAR